MRSSIHRVRARAKALTSSSSRSETPGQGRGGWFFSRPARQALDRVSQRRLLRSALFFDNKLAQSSPGSNIPRPSAGGSDCTTARHKAHGTEMEVHYRWHPWFGLKVAVHRSFTRQGVAAVHAVIEKEDQHQVLEMPSWMFDPATCAAMPLVDHPYVGLKHLQALKELLKSLAGEAAIDVIETQRLYSSGKGDADEKEEELPSLATQPVSATDSRSALGIPAPRSATASPAPARAAAARCSQQSPRRSSKGGAR